MLLERLAQHHDSPLEAQAIGTLRHIERYPGLPPWDTSTILFQLTQIPSFAPYSVWGLHLHEGTYTVRRVYWDQTADHHPLGIVPRTYGADARLSSAVAQKLIEDLTPISLPPFLPAAEFCLDGASYEIEFRGLYRSACLNWWSHFPPEWQPLVDWYEEAIHQFESVLPAGTAPRLL